MTFRDLWFLHKFLCHEVITVDDDELFEIVRRNYSKTNKEYIQEQISVASEYLTDKQKEELRQKGIPI